MWDPEAPKHPQGQQAPGTIPGKHKRRQEMLLSAMVLFGEAERCRWLQGRPEGPGGPGSSAEVQAQVGRAVPLSPPFSV